MPFDPVTYCEQGLAKMSTKIYFQFFGESR